MVVGRISNLMVSILKALELLNNFAEDAIFLSDQASEIFAKDMFTFTSAAWWQNFKSTSSMIVLELPNNFAEDVIKSEII